MPESAASIRYGENKHEGHLHPSERRGTGSRFLRNRRRGCVETNLNPVLTEEAISLALFQLAKGSGDTNAAFEDVVRAKEQEKGPYPIAFALARRALKMLPSGDVDAGVTLASWPPRSHAPEN